MGWISRLFRFGGAEKPAAKPQRPVSSNKPAQPQRAKVPAPNVTQPKTGQTVVLSSGDSAQVLADVAKLARQSAAPKVVSTVPDRLTDRTKPPSDADIAAFLNAPTQILQGDILSSNAPTESEMQIASTADTQEMEMPGDVKQPPSKPKSEIIKAGSKGKEKITSTTDTTSKVAEDLLDKMLNRTRKKKQ